VLVSPAPNPALTSDLKLKFGNLGSAALEALAAEAYEKEVLSLEQVRRLLDQARKQQLIPAIRPLLDRLQSHARFWISSSLLQQILQAANE